MRVRRYPRDKVRMDGPDHDSASRDCLGHGHPKQQDEAQKRLALGYLVRLLGRQSAREWVSNRAQAASETEGQDQ